MAHQLYVCILHICYRKPVRNLFLTQPSVAKNPNVLTDYHVLHSYTINYTSCKNMYEFQKHTAEWKQVTSYKVQKNVKPKIQHGRYSKAKQGITQTKVRIVITSKGVGEEIATEKGTQGTSNFLCYMLKKYFASIKVLDVYWTSKLSIFARLLCQLHLDSWPRETVG